MGWPQEPGDAVGGEVRAGTLHPFLEGAEKVPNHQKKSPLLHQGLKRALKPQWGPPHPRAGRHRVPAAVSPQHLGFAGDVFRQEQK